MDSREHKDFFKISTSIIVEDVKEKFLMGINKEP